jgi:hypothetical protein
MHKANFRMLLINCCASACVGALLFGSRCWQACPAVRTWELLTPSCWGVSSDLSKVPLLVGSGQCCTPCQRMQRAKANTPEFGDAWACDEPLGLLNDGLPPQAVTSRAGTAVAMMAPATRAVSAKQDVAGT